jgi:hypothetical protein
MKCLRFVSKRKTVRVRVAFMCGRGHRSHAARDNPH